jgi:peptidoglycan/LPS O-acetylase OafA/YrhL
MYGRNPWFNPYFLASDLPANLLLLPGLGIGNPMIGPAWSVSVELVAYVGFPLLAALAFRADRTVRIALPALAALVLLSLTQLDTDHEGGRLADNLLRCLSEFSLGMTAFGIHRAGRLRWLATDEATVLVAGGIMLSLLLGVDPAASLLFPFLLIACAGNTGLAARALGTAVPYFLGEISYAIYMLHNTLREPSIRLFRLVHPDPLGIPAALGLALGMGLAVIPFAWIAHRAVERPCRAWGRRLLAAA